MGEWKNFEINTNMIATSTEKSVLIKMPNFSDYPGYKFWHPAKLVRNGRHSASVSIGYSTDFEFKIFKSGKGKYNQYEKIDEKTIGFEEFEHQFNVTDENISCPKRVNQFETFKPADIEPDKNVKVIEELKDE